MAVAFFIVTFKSVAHYAFKHRAVNRFYAVRQHKFRLLQKVQRHARVAAAKISQCFQRLVRHGKPLPAVAVFLISQRLLQIFLTAFLSSRSRRIIFIRDKSGALTSKTGFP